MNDGVSPLTQGARDLAATARSLEDLGLVESTHYRPTEAGRKALKP